MVARAVIVIQSEVSIPHANDQPDSVIANQELLGKFDKSMFFSSEVNKIIGYISDYVVINVHHTNMVSQMKVASYAIVTQVVQMDSNVMQTVNVHVMTMSKADDVTDVKRTNITVI